MFTMAQQWLTIKEATCKYGGRNGEKSFEIHKRASRVSPAGCLRGKCRLFYLLNQRKWTKGNERSYSDPSQDTLKSVKHLTNEHVSQYVTREATGGEGQPLRDSQLALSILKRRVNIAQHHFADPVT